MITVSRQNADGSVEVWADGWHVTFPGGHAERGTPPEGLKGQVAGVTVAKLGNRLGVRFGDELIKVGGTDFGTKVTDPRLGDKRRVFYKHLPGRERDGWG